MEVTVKCGSMNALPSGMGMPRFAGKKMSEFEW